MGLTLVMGNLTCKSFMAQCQFSSLVSEALISAHIVPGTRLRTPMNALT